MEIEKWKTQCRYLQSELDSMKQQLEDAKELIKLNKEQLKICYNPSLFDQSSESKAALVLLKFVQEENEFLNRKVESLSDERNMAFDKVPILLIEAFISEQINESNQRVESQLIINLNKTITDLKKKLNEHTQMQNEMMGTIYLEKHVQINQLKLAQPDHITMTFNNTIQQMNTMLLKQKLQIEELTEQKNDLAQLNFSLSNEILKMRTQRFTPRNQTKTFFSSNEDPTKFINNLVQCNEQIYLVQKRLFFDDDSLDEKQQMQQSAVFSPLFSPSLPQKVKRQQKHVPSSNQEPEKYIPKLDLTKAQQIQQFNIKRMQILSNKLANEGVEQKIYMYELQYFRLQDELLRTKNKYHAQLVLNQQLDLQLTELNFQNQELKHVNETLIKSYQMYDEKWGCIYQQFQFYKEFFFKHKDSIQTQISSHNGPKDQSQFSIIELEKVMNSSKIQQKKNSQKTNVTNPALSIINYQDDFLHQSSCRLPTERQEEATKLLNQQYKTCLMMMAKDVFHIDYQNAKIQKAEGDYVKIKRSYSNTIEYFPIF